MTILACCSFFFPASFTGCFTNTYTPLVVLISAIIKHLGITTPPSSQPVMLISSPSTKSVSNSKANSMQKDDKSDDINVMPASVEDHFAKALGEQWSKLNSNNSVSMSPPTNTVIS